MSIGGALSLTLLEGAGLAFLQTLLGRSVVRSMNWATLDPQTGGVIAQNSILPQIVIEERHLDRMTITEHPVEQGAAISDHAYKNPAEIVMRCGWSTSGGGIATGTRLASLPSNITILPKFGDPNILRTVYSRLLSLQESRQRIAIVTGKRTYLNMLIAALSVSTDKKSENMLDVTAVFRQVVIANTRVVTMPPPEQQQMPEKTGAQENGGSKQLQPAPNFNPQGLY